MNPDTLGVNTALLVESERHGIDAISEDDLNIYSVGVSTGGQAEAVMAAMNPNRHIIATTIDKNGIEIAKEYLKKANLSSQIEIKLEDVSQPLPYKDDYFDFIYARLVLHYLTKKDLVDTLLELKRILKVGGKMYIVVRSKDCDCAKADDSTYDPITGLTEYTDIEPVTGKIKRPRRHFFSENELAERLAGVVLEVKYMTSYDETLYIGFNRTAPSKNHDNLIETLVIKK